VDRCEEIVANVRMEERYAGLSLVFQGTEALREEIESAIEKVTQETKMAPHIFDNSKDHHESKQALYIEFNDDVQRDSGDFFERLLKALHIDHCANDVI